MATRYRIHPGIGIGRIGNSPDEFFLAPELPGASGAEIRADGNEVPVTGYKDGEHRIKRQGVRFRVFEYSIDAAGRETVVREITAREATITWHVRLANSKAAGRRILEQGNALRNPNTPPAELIIAPQLDPIAGIAQRAPERVTGRFKNRPVPLGDLRTDAAGRLIVLGGFGKSASVPAGSGITNFANNPNWHDDVSDGPVDAELRFPDGSQVTVNDGAWVVFAPPDFAPGILGLTTMYDVALDAAVTRGWVRMPTRPSFRRHVLPILQRATALRFVNQFPYWNSFSRDFATLGRLGDPTADNLRVETFALLMDVESSGVLSDFRFGDVQRAVLEQWVGGTFEADFDVPEDPVPAGPPTLDRAALEQGVGGGFFPGIEIGILSTNPSLYAEPYRFTRASFVDGSETIRLEAGSITQRMAVPWQADFLKCQSNWWPAQRPDQVFLRAADQQPRANWIDGITSHVDLAQNFWKLGVVTGVAGPGGMVHVETERDPSLPHAGG